MFPAAMFLSINRLDLKTSRSQSLIFPVKDEWDNEFSWQNFQDQSLVYLKFSNTRFAGAKR